MSRQFTAYVLVPERREMGAVRRRSAPRLRSGLIKTAQKSVRFAPKLQNLCCALSTHESANSSRKLGRSGDCIVQILPKGRNVKARMGKRPLPSFGTPREGSGVSVIGVPGHHARNDHLARLR